MKKSKLINVFIPTTLVLTTTGVVLPLASCAKESPVVKDKVSLGSDANQTLDDNNEATFTLKLDNDYDNVQVAFDGEHSDWFKTTKIAHLKDTVTIKVQFLSTVNEDTTFPFRFSVTTPNWTAPSPDVSVNVTAKVEQETVDKINEILSTSTVKPTLMSGLIALLNLKGINLEALPTNDSTSQWVWDAKENVVFVLKQDGTVKCAPKDYTLNSNTHQIWKMVGGNKTSNLRFSLKEESVNKDTFSSTCVYSQYLRTGESFTTELKFCSGIDTGEHEKLELTYTPDLTTSTEPVVIYTMKSSLNVEGSLNSINHYGNLTELKVQSIDEEQAYNEYGSVDSAITVVSGTIAAQQGSDVNTIVVAAESADDVKIVVEEKASVGSVSATTAEIAEKLNDPENPIVVVSQQAETQPTIETTPTPVPSTELYFYSGNGTIKSPWAIKTKEQLWHMADKFNDSEYVPEDGKYYFNLIADIDMSGEDNWVPVGTFEKTFKGIFNGCGFTISNITYENTIISNKYALYGLFGITDGDENSKYGVLSDVWDDDTNKLDYDKVSEFDEDGVANYTTAIKNLTIENVTSKFEKTETDSAYCVGGLVGAANNTYIYNCNVKSGTIHGHKHVGGLAGTIYGSIIDSCTIGDESNNADPLTIEAEVYNVGGISGSLDYLTTYGYVYGCSGYIDCVTQKNTTIKALAAKGGSIGGIVGHNSTAHGCFCVDCENNATIEVTSPSTSEPASQVAGIAGFGQNCGAFSNCVNKGHIKINEGSAANYVSGISSQPIGNKFYKCKNEGKLEGYAVYGMAGIAAGCNVDLTSVPVKFVECENTGSLVCSNENAAVAPICSNATVVRLQNQHFANANEINNCIKSLSSQYIKLELVDCTIDDATGTIDIPNNLISVTSNTTICSKVHVGNVSTLTVDIPSVTILADSETSCSVECTSSDSIIQIDQNAKVLNAKVSGKNSKVVNNGTVTNTIGVNGLSTYSENNGTCGNVEFDCSKIHTEEEKVFVNNGIVNCSATSTNPAALKVNYSYGKTGKVLIKNNNEINYVNNSVANTGLLWFSGSNTTVDLECYENSKLTSDVDQFIYLGWPGLVNVKYKASAQLLLNASPKEWSSLAVAGKVTVIEF